MAEARLLTTVFVETVKATARREEYPDTKVAGLRLIVQPQPSGSKSWAVRYRFEGLPAKYTVPGSYPAVDLRSARKSAREALVLVGRGINPAAEKQAVKAAEKAARAAQIDPSCLVENVVEEFVERYAKRRTADWQETRRRLVKDVSDRWRGKLIENIGRADIVRMLDDIVERGAERGVNRTYAAVRKFFNWCVERGIIERSPCAGITKPAVERSRDRVLNDRELGLLWNSVEALQFPYREIVRLLMLTGARRDEIASMRWSEIDLRARVFNLPKERSKNGRAHTLPLSESAVGILSGLTRFSHTDLVFSASGKGAPTGWTVIKRKIDRSVAEINCGDEIAHFVIHDVRRSVASGMAALGVPLHVIERVLNHVSGSFGGVAGVYNRHSYAEEMRAALDAWGRHIEENCEARVK